MAAVLTTLYTAVKAASIRLQAGLWAARLGLDRMAVPVSKAPVPRVGLGEISARLTGPVELEEPLVAVPAR